MSEVILENVTKKFDEVTAVDNVNLKIRPREFLTLLGPSGCGKTTTLRLIAGLEEATSGNIYIGENIVNALSPKDRNIAMVFQSYALYPHMTVFDNIGFPLRIGKIPKTDIARKVEEAATLLGINDLLDRKPKELSGGQRQRVALGRAIVRSPNVFLMDEPLSNLDAKLRVQMRVELKRLQKTLSITTIYVTHDQIEAMTMSDRVALMNNGRVMQVGGSEDVYNNPDDIWVAGFIGSPPVNLIDCSFEERKEGGFLVHESFELSLPQDLSEILSNMAQKGEIVLGFRPEDVSIIKQREENTLEAQVYALEPIGEALIVDLMIGDDIVKVRTEADQKFKIGSHVYLKINFKKIHLFEGGTKKRIII